MKPSCWPELRGALAVLGRFELEGRAVEARTQAIDGAAEALAPDQPQEQPALARPVEEQQAHENGQKPLAGHAREGEQNPDDDQYEADEVAGHGPEGPEGDGSAFVARGLTYEVIGPQLNHEGDHHGVDLARPVGNLAVTHMRAGELELAQIHLRRAIQLIEDESGPMHASLGVHWFNLASVRLEKGELELALAALERCIEVDEHVVGRRHPNVAQTLTAMASIHARSGEADLAMKLLEEALQIFADFEVDPLLVGVTRLRLGKLLWSEDRDRARALIDQADEAFTAAADAAGPELDQLREWQDEVGY